MVLLYTHKITPRLTFTVKQLFRRIMGYEVSITDSVDVFIKHTGAKLSYAKQPLQNEFFIRANHLLFERILEPQDISWKSWEGTPCFFDVDSRSSIPFDILAASFYLLSRYEEYLPHQKDGLGRFRSIESVLSDRHGAFSAPLVDQWAYRLRKIFSQRFPDEPYTDRNFRFFLGVPVIQSHAFRFRGLGRHIFESFEDLFAGRLSAIAGRFKVMAGIAKDPYDHYLKLRKSLQKLGVEIGFFFQFAPYHVRDRNISWNRLRFGYFLKHIADYTSIGYYRSQGAMLSAEQFKVEIDRLDQLLHRKVSSAIIAQNRVLLPDAYEELVAQEISDDYSMGYDDAIGFKSGTCTPYPFYNLGLELEQPLKVHPFVVSDVIFTIEERDKIVDKLRAIKDKVAEVDGTFYLQFGNRAIGSLGVTNFINLIKEIDG